MDRPEIAQVRYEIPVKDGDFAVQGDRSSWQAGDRLGGARKPPRQVLPVAAPEGYPVV